MPSSSFESQFEKIAPPLPALELRDKPRPSSGAFLSLFLLAIAMGVAAKYAVPAHIHAELQGPDIWTLSGAATLFAAMAAVIVLHEAGHLAAAILMNFEILGLALGPFRVARLNGTWQLRFTPRTLFSGSVSALPRTADAWRQRMMAVVAGGPLATLATGVLAAALLLSNQPANGLTASAYAAWAHAFLGAVTQLSAFIFVLGLIPNSRNARIRNDARLLSVLRHDSREAREILLYHRLTQLELAGVRPRDYPEQLMAELAQTQGRPDLMLFNAHKIVLWALDLGQLSTADAWDQRCLELSEKCQPASRNLALANSACLDVLVRNNPLHARGKFAEVDWQTLSPSWLMHRSRAAYYLTMANVPECLAEVSRAQYAFPKLLPVFVFERTLLSQLHHKALNLQPPEPQSRHLTPVGSSPKVSSCAA